VIDHRQADAEEDHQRLRRIADAEPQHDQRHQRGLRHRIDDHQQRIEERRHEPAAPHHQADRHRDGERQREAGHHAADRVENGDQRFPVGEDPRQFAQRQMSGRQPADGGRI
jgi:hypothetical protein